MKISNLRYIVFGFYILLVACNSNSLDSMSEVSEANIEETTKCHLCSGGADTMLIKLNEKLFFCPLDSVINVIDIEEKFYFPDFFNEGLLYFVKNNELLLFEDTLIFKSRYSAWSLIQGEFNTLDTVFISFSFSYDRGDRVLFSTVEEIKAKENDLDFLINSDIEVVNLEFTKRNVTYFGKLEYRDYGYANSYSKEIPRDHFVFYVEGTIDKNEN